MPGWEEYDRAEHVNKFGYNPSIDAATPEDVWSGGGNYTWVSAAGALTVVSDSANDVGGGTPGTGARTVVVEYLDSNYKTQTVTVTLNGTTPVNPSLTAIRCHRAYVATAGSGGTNAGNISVKIGTPVVAHIAANAGQTLQATYTIPADYSKAYLHRVYHSIAQKTSAMGTFTLYFRPFGGAWRILRINGVSTLSEEVFEDDHAILLLPKTDLYMRADVSANGTAVAGGFDIVFRR